MVYKILGGPSKLDLMNSLFEGKIVHFTVQYGEGKKMAYSTVQYGYLEPKTTKIKVVVSSVSAEDGSHDKWLLKIVVKESDVYYFKTIRNLSAFYNSRDRTGHLRIQ
ncbi:MAG TPA: hypothetical protein PLV35_01415 [Candidatus Paceibacterota bacterium]|mgnify:CR=1 FL=1|jgi:hypothetical protein|nr:hypothetical protein [Candidatus Paceibacterota bacterium]